MDISLETDGNDAQLVLQCSAFSGRVYRNAGDGDFNNSDCAFMWCVVSSTASEPLELWQQCAKQSVQKEKTTISSRTSETVDGSNASMWSGQCKGHG